MPSMTALSRGTGRGRFLGLCLAFALSLPWVNSGAPVRAEGLDRKSVV